MAEYLVGSCFQYVQILMNYPAASGRGILAELIFSPQSGGVLDPLRNKHRSTWKETIKRPHPDRMLAAHGIKIKEAIYHTTDQYTEDLIADMFVKTKCSSCGNDNSYTYQDIVKRNVENIIPHPKDWDFQPSRNTVERFPYRGNMTKWNTENLTSSYSSKLGGFQTRTKGGEIALRKTPKPFQCAKCGTWNRWVTKEMILARIKYVFKTTGWAWLLGPLPLTMYAISKYSYDADTIMNLGRILVFVLASWLLILLGWSLLKYYSDNPEDLEPPELRRLPTLRIFSMYVMVVLGLSIVAALASSNTLSSNFEDIVPSVFTISSIVAFVFPLRVGLRNFF